MKESVTICGITVDLESRNETWFTPRGEMYDVTIVECIEPTGERWVWKRAARGANRAQRRFATIAMRKRGEPAGKFYDQGFVARCRHRSATA